VKIGHVNIKEFRGLNTVGEPSRDGVSWLGVADNVNITRTGAIERRTGYTQIASANCVGAFSTKEHDRAYVATTTGLHAFDGASLQLIAALTSSQYPYWAEVNNDVYFHNGTDALVIRQGKPVIPWAWTPLGAVGLRKTSGTMPAGTYQVRASRLLPDGRETGAGPSASIVLTTPGAIEVYGLPSDGARIYMTAPDGAAFMLAAELPPGATSHRINAVADDLGVYAHTAELMPVPANAVAIQHWRGRMYAATYMAAENISVVWFSQPLGFHLFDYAADFLMVPGKVRMLAPTTEALIIGTDKGIHAYSGESLSLLAPYGVVPGKPWANAETEGNVLIWSLRGLCEALPFRNVTERFASVQPGEFVSAALIEDDGHTRLLASLSAGGTAFNPRNRSFP